MPEIIHIPATSSTNSLLKKMIESNHSLPTGTLLRTSFQTNGKGQGGNHWEAEEGKNLLCSVLLKPKNLAANEQFLISQAVALGIIDFLQTYGDNFSIKWPNDIYWKEKKIAGILIENSISKSKILDSIIGIGLNLNQTDFKSDAPNPISLKNISKLKFNIENVAKDLQQSILNRFAQIETQNKNIRTAYKNLLFRRNKWAKFKENKQLYLGCIVDVEKSGHLIIQTKDDGTRRYAFKEVSFIL